MPSKTDFNVSPYYDDYSESKKFHRVLNYRENHYFLRTVQDQYPWYSFLYFLIYQFALQKYI